MEKSRNAVKTVSFIMIITMAGKILGLYRDMLLASNYGVGMESNAFSMASMIPRTFFDAVFASAITSSFIPVFNEFIETKGKKEAFDFSNIFVSMILVSTIFITILGMGFTLPLTNWFADGFDAETAVLCSRLLKIMFPTIVFTGIAYSFVGILQSLEEFNVPAAMSIVSNGIIILYYFFFNKQFGIYGLAVAFLLGWLMQAVIQVPSLIQKKYTFRFRMNFCQEGMKKVYYIMIPVMISTWVQPINTTISMKFASRIFEGDGVTAINYANNLYIIIIGVFVLSIANVVFPQLSKLTANKEEKEFNHVICQTIKVMMFLVIPMTIGLMALSRPVISLLYEGNRFNSFATEITSRALFYMAIGMIGFALQTVLSRAFFAIQDGKTPLYAGIASILINYILCVSLVQTMDVGGLALAASLSSIVNGVILFFLLERKKGKLMEKGFVKGLLFMLIAALFMAVVVLLIQNIIAGFLPASRIGKAILVAVPAGIGVCIYLCFTWLMGMEEAKIVFGFAKKLLHRQ